MAGSNRRGRTLQYDFNSDPRQSQQIQREILDTLAEFGFGYHSTYAIKLSLEEAMTNAIKHGNHFDPSKHVRILAKISPKKFDITIEDQGAGFDRSKVPDPTHDDNLERCSGRGILLIESYMDQAQWTKRGRKLHMSKRNEADEPPSGDSESASQAGSAHSGKARTDDGMGPASLRS